MDIFKSVPAKGAIVRDWTGETLTVDIENSIGETFHFEVKPNEKDNLPTRASDTPFTNSRNNRSRAVLVDMTLPIL